MSPLTAFPSPKGEKPEGTRAPGQNDASLTDTEHGGTPAGATIDVQEPRDISPASAEPTTSAQQPDPDDEQTAVESRILAPGDMTSVHWRGGDDQSAAPRSEQAADLADPPPADSQAEPLAAAILTSTDPVQTEAATTAPADVNRDGAVDIDNGMDEFQRLRRRLLVSTLLASSAAVPLCWLLFDGPAALSLLVGSVAGLLYLVLLARSVARLGGERRSVSKVQLLVPVVLVLASARITQLELVPALVGFLLYKPALLVQALLDR